MNLVVLEFVFSYTVVENVFVSNSPYFKCFYLGMEAITRTDISCKDCAETVNLIIKKLGQPIMTNLYYNTVKMLLERMSSVMIDKANLKVSILSLVQK